MAHVATPGMAVTYIRSTGEHVSATMMKCRLCGPKRAMGLGALAMCLRASFTSPKILLMTVLSQGIGSPKGKHVQLFKMRRKVGKGFYSTAPDGPDGQ